MAAAEGATATRLDVGALWDLLKQPWRDLHRRAPFSWLAPQPAVRVFHADGSDSLWLGDRRQASTERGRQAAPFVAVELPREEHLECTLHLPAMAAADLQDALVLEVRTASPFDPADLVWGHRQAPATGAATTETTAVLASRRAVQARLDEAAARLGARGPAEVWAFDSRGRPVVLQGFGEAARQRRGARDRVVGLALLLIASLLATAALLTPTVQLKLRAMQAVRANQLVEAQLAPVLVQREALVKAQAQQEALRELMAERVEPLAVLELITQAVPDDTWVQRLQLQGSRLTINGQTPNTAALMNKLSGQALVRDVKAPTAATRAISGRENFSIELTLEPEALRPASTARAQPAVTAPVLPGVAPAPVSASASTPAATPASAPRAATPAAASGAGR